MSEQIEQNSQPKRRSMWPYQIAIGALIILIYLAVVVYNRRDSGTGSEVAQNQNTTQSVNSETGGEVNGYKDGTYTALGNYISPGGREEFSVSLTLKDGVVTDSSVNPGSPIPTSVQFQEQFANGYKQFVIGKSIADLKVGKVAGSSLTPVGFNDAVEKIKAQAAL